MWQWLKTWIAWGWYLLKADDFLLCEEDLGMLVRRLVCRWTLLSLKWWHCFIMGTSVKFGAVQWEAFKRKSGIHVYVGLLNCFWRSQVDIFSVFWEISTYFSLYLHCEADVHFLNLTIWETEEWFWPHPYICWALYHKWHP